MNAVASQKQEGAVSKVRRDEERYLTPEVNIYENKDDYLLQAEMPGVTKDGLELTLEGHVLTIVGHRSQEMPKGSTPLYRESQPYDFRRVFELDPTIETGKINAKMEQGVLVVRLPKAEKVKPRKISITAE